MLTISKPRSEKYFDLFLNAAIQPSFFIYFTLGNLGWIKSDSCSFGKILSNELEVGVYTYFHLPQLPTFLELSASLEVVSAVSPHQGFILSDNHDSIASRKTANELNSLVTVS